MEHTIFGLIKKRGELAHQVYRRAPINVFHYADVPRDGHQLTWFACVPQSSCQPQAAV